VAPASEIPASGVAVTIVVHERKRLGRCIELAALAEQLRAADIGLEFLTGELQIERAKSPAEVRRADEQAVRLSAAASSLFPRHHAALASHAEAIPGCHA
jgi:hypothetical protein